MTTTEPSSAESARGKVLARDVGEYLIELAIALHKHGIYPAGHPALGQISARVLDRLEALLEERPSLALGVARTQLMIEGIATDASHPVLRQLALRFHEHHLAALRFFRGVEESELRELLVSLGREVGGGGDPLGLRETLPSWPHIRLSALGLGDLEIVDSDESGEQGISASRLWLDLARAALAREQEGPMDESELSPSVVARAIDRRSGSDTYDQVIAGYLIEITRSVEGGEAVAGAPLRDRLGRLVRELSPETLRRLMAHGGDRSQQQTFLRSAAAGLPVDSVVRLLSAASQAGGQSLSEYLIRMYEKLAVHALSSEPETAERADHELRAHVQTLVDNWGLPDPTPQAYARALGAIASSRAGAWDGPDVSRSDPERVLKMCLELEVTGAMMQRAVDRLVEEGRARAVLDMAEEAGPSRATAAARAWLVRVDRLPELLQQAALDMTRTVNLVERLGEGGVEQLLDVLLASEDRGVRRRTFDLLAALGPVVAPAVDARFDGETRWYALRNLLALHDALGTTPVADVHMLAAHEDWRVRREALKLLLRDRARRGEVVLRILADGEPRLMHLLRGAEDVALPPSALPLLRRRLAELPADDPIRVSMARLVGQVPGDEARDALLELAVRRRTLLRRPAFRTTPTAVAALRALASGWASDPDVGKVLRLALSDPDPAVRAAARPGAA